MGRDKKNSEILVTKFTEDSAQEFRERILEIAEHDPNQVIPIRIDSYGGNVDSLMKMIETMDEVDNRFITHCSGKAMSCGAILLSHGDIRFIGKYSRALIHNVSSFSYGCALDQKQGAAETMRLNKMALGLLAENCGMTYKELQEHIKATDGSKDIIMSANQAKKFGLVDHVGAPLITAATYWRVDTVPAKPPLDIGKPKKKKK
jgi:ATP-dependent Clp protease protease subunit